MERIDHIHIVQISSSSFISQIYRMLQWNIPDREGLKLRIACMDAPLVFVVQLGQTGGHFSTSWSRCSDDNQRTGSLDIIIFSITFITDDQRNIARVARNHIMGIYLDTQFLKTAAEHIGTVLTCILCDDNASHI